MTPLLALPVVFLTALALLVPAVSITDDAAVPETGFFAQAVDEREEVGETVNASVEEEAQPKESAQDQAENEASANADGDATRNEAAANSGGTRDSAAKPEADASDAEGPEANAEDAKALAEGAEAPDTDADAKAEKKAQLPAQTFEQSFEDAKGRVNFSVHVEAPEGALPEGATMKVSKVKPAKVKDAVEDALVKDAAAKDAEPVRVREIQAVDITFQDADGAEVEPLRAVSVKMMSTQIKDQDEPLVVHVDDDGSGDVVQQLSKKELKKRDQALEDNELMFDADAFSVYVIVYTLDYRWTVNGATYCVSVTYGEDAQIPEGAQLQAKEIPPESKSFDAYVNDAESALGWDAGGASYARVFDISILDSRGEEIQPAAPVQVSVELQDAQGDNQSPFTVVHFGDKPQKMDASTDGNTVSFSATGFSAYAIVQGPSSVPVGWTKVTKLADLAAKAADGLYIGTTSGYYLTNVTAVGSKDSSAMGIVKTTPAQDYPTDAAVKYYFEQVSGTDNQFYIYCYDGSDKKYVNNSGGTDDAGKNLYLVDEAEKTVFTVLVDNNGRFRFQNGSRYWNMWNGANGNHIAAWTAATDGNNYFYLWDYEETVSDPYALDGKAYGLMYWVEGVSGKALMAKEDGSGALGAEVLTVMAKKSNNATKLYVTADSDISEWTFEWVEQDVYHLKTTVDGSTKYLSVSSAGVQLKSEPDESCNIQVVPGTGTHAGEICLKAGGKTLTYSGSVDTGFNVGGAAGSEWLHLTELSELTKDYVQTYQATKVGVADDSVIDGSRIIVYTRVWNDTTKKYEFYAIDHDGSLVRCYESGDNITWVAGQINTLLWNFTEYTNSDGTPNYYYELFNQYSEKYIAPQVADNQILSDETIGINMDGRRNGRYYTPIVAWDDDNYAYAGLKVENGKIVSCPIDEADDFYFAIMNDVAADDELHTVSTVDHTQYGITMKLQNYRTQINVNGQVTSQDQHDVMGTIKYVKGQYTPGLLSTNLGEDGYPTVVSTDKSLGLLYGNTTEVNHLFLSSTYNSSGYFEYDSTQNFAHLNADGNFTLYQEIGTVDTNSGQFFTHGQFLPYNDIEPGVFSTKNPKNLTNSMGNTLPNDDPRKYEQLYLAKNPDFYYGMEVEASFVQTPSGKDDWGHDIIYEFTGDDDFWLYVDGELVIDLGGIHDAFPGSVNYATGEVVVNGQATTLKDIFYNNYKGRGHTDAEAQAYVDGLFEQNAAGKWVFKDNSSHTMKIFYMERGAGAANLHMRFNLASIKPGTVLLSKELAGVDTTESVLAEFPYQVFYTKNGVEYPLKNASKGDTSPKNYVFYENSTTPVKFAEELTVDGVQYENVFLLKPGQKAEINFPQFTEDNEGVDLYRIVECGVNTSVYTSVTVNGETVEGTAVEGSTTRKDYGIVDATTNERAVVKYANAVTPDALRTLTFTKKLFEEDGVTELTRSEDATEFSFRLYLGTELDEGLTLANMHTYHVKDENGNYCSWDATEKKFVPTGKSDYDSLSADEKKAVTFHTSINGAISKIPVGYTVEVREVLAGTRFMVQERPWEIPDGYSFQKYVYDETVYTGTTADEKDTAAEAGVTGTVTASADPHVDICNLKGWGLRVNKTWSDADFMSNRDATYFAVFTNDGAGNLTPVEGTVRQMAYTDNPQSLYWYFLPLPVNVPFDQYEIREVTLSNENPTVDEDGVVTDYGTLTPIANRGTLSINGTQKGESAESSFEYTVNYTKGEVASDSNVRVDAVTNYRPGIVLKKTDWAGNALAGATFELEDADGTKVGTFTSDDEGLITVAFLRDDVDYTLTETKAPQGYQGLQAPVTLSLSKGQLSVNGVGTQWYATEEGDTPTLIVKDRPFTFNAVKVNGDSNEPLKNVKFELHKQVTVDGVTAIDVNPISGYETLTTTTDGTIPKIDNTLPAGTYELREKATLSGYQALSGYIRFMVSPTGAVTLAQNAPAEATLEANVDDDAKSASYTLTVKNYINGTVTLKKVNENGAALTGSKFALCKFTTSWEIVDDYAQIDLTAAATKKLEKLTAGRYRLEEVAAPTGYVMLSKQVYFTVSSTGVVALTDEAGTGANDNEYASLSNEVITIKNMPGSPLPVTGSCGTGYLYLGGTLLICGAIAILLSRRLSRKPS